MSNIKLAIAFYDSHGLTLEIFSNVTEAYKHLEHLVNRQRISNFDKTNVLKNVMLQFKALRYDYSGILQDERAEENFEESIVAEFSIKRVG